MTKRKSNRAAQMRTQIEELQSENQRLSAKVDELSEALENAEKEVTENDV